MSFQKKDQTLLISISALTDETLISPEENEVILESFGLTYFSEENEFGLRNISVTQREIICKIQYKEWSHTLVFQLAPKTQIVDAVFDFGSEASQVAALFHDSYAIAPMSLVHHAHDHFYSDAFPERNLTPKDFYQYEDDQNHKHVLLSYFFIKAQGGVLHKTEVPFKNAQQSLIKILTSDCLLYTSPSPRDKRQSRMPSSA